MNLNSSLALTPLSEIQTLSSTMASQSLFEALRTAVLNARGARDLLSVTMDRPSSETVPGLPRMGQLDDTNLKKALPGSLAVSYSDVTHYVPLVDSIRERAG